MPRPGGDETSLRRLFPRSGGRHQNPEYQIGGPDLIAFQVEADGASNGMLMFAAHCFTSTQREGRIFEWVKEWGLSGCEVLRLGPHRRGSHRKAVQLATFLESIHQPVGFTTAASPGLRRVLRVAVFYRRCTFAAALAE